MIFAKEVKRVFVVVDVIVVIVIFVVLAADVDGFVVVFNCLLQFY